MNKLIIGACVLFILSTSCVKDSIFDSGTILGSDQRDCACCGGWLVEIDSDTYRFNVLPEGSNINLEEATFPLEVLLNWSKDQNGCLGDEIIVHEINFKPINKERL